VPYPSGEGWSVGRDRNEHVLAGPIPELPKYSRAAIIVKFNEGVEQDVRDQVIREHGCCIRRTCEPVNVHLVGIPESGVPEEYGWGLIDANAALTYKPPRDTRSLEEQPL